LVVAAMAAVYVYMAVTLPGGPDGMSDLHVYYGAVRTLLDGSSLYDFVSFNGDLFVYPPFAGVVFVPLALLPELWLRVLWTLLQCAEAAVLAWAIAARASMPVIARAPRILAVPVLTCVLLAIQPVFTGIFLGQVSLLITLLALLDALDLVPRPLQGIATGVAAAIKLTPLAFVPFLWLTGRRRAATVALGTFVLCTAAAWWAVPDDSLRYWPSGLATPDFINLAQSDNQSVHGFLARVGWEEPIRTVALACGVVTVVAMGYLRSRRAYLDGQRLAAAVIVGALVVLVSPISWSHHQTMLAVAAACAVSSTSRTLNRVWSTAVLLLVAVPFPVLLNRAWPAGQLITDSVLMVLALLVACVIPFRPGQPVDRADGRSQPRASIQAMSSANLTSESSTGE
jgi:alpha-1,2-mannosyltransferase